MPANYGRCYSSVPPNMRMKPPFLAPKIVEMITAGKQPPDLTAEALAERTHLPLFWTDQEQAVVVS